MPPAKILSFFLRHVAGSLVTFSLRVTLSLGVLSFGCGALTLLLEASFPPLVVLVGTLSLIAYVVGIFEISARLLVLGIRC